ncbi:MAG: hypothetical protein M1504_02455, partial [Candidatus Marsarchaeota archaeon]|nr:hypothetical protein [Candidatus Marsarchaeota archaeon]
MAGKQKSKTTVEEAPDTKPIIVVPISELYRGKDHDPVSRTKAMNRAFKKGYGIVWPDPYGDSEIVDN